MDRESIEYVLQTKTPDKRVHKAMEAAMLVLGLARNDAAVSGSCTVPFNYCFHDSVVKFCDSFTELECHSALLSAWSSARQNQALRGVAYQLL